MGDKLGSERATILDNDGEGNTPGEKVRALALVLSRGHADLVEMLGLGDFLRERQGLDAAECPTCEHPMGEEHHGRRANGRRFCRSIENDKRAAMRARQRAAEGEAAA